MSTHKSEIILKEINHNNIGNNINTFVDIIFNNFSELANIPYINHSRDDIHRLLSSENMFGYFVIYSTKIIAYVIGESIQMHDGRHAYYLSYIYVADKYQHIKIGTLLIKKIIFYCTRIGIPFIVQTCDINNIKLIKFYKKFGFIYDPILKNNKQHEILCLYI